MTKTELKNTISACQEFVHLLPFLFFVFFCFFVVVAVFLFCFCFFFFFILFCFVLFCYNLVQSCAVCSHLVWSMCSNKIIEQVRHSKNKKQMPQGGTKLQRKDTYLQSFCLFVVSEHHWRVTDCGHSTGSRYTLSSGNDCHES